MGGSVETLAAVAARVNSRSPRDAHPTGSSPPVGGRLQLHVEEWENIAPGRWVLETIRSGYRIEFTAQPPMSASRRITQIPADPEQRQALEGEIAALLQKRAIQPVPAGPGGPRFYSTFFLTPKKNGKWRPILNLKPLNKGFIRPKPFRMETLRTIVPLLHQGMWATSVDLSDAYLHIPVCVRDRAFLAFSYQGTDYCFTCIPFGLSTAPRVFTRVTRAVLAYLRRQGLTVFAYIDDWFIVAETKRRAIEATSTTLALLERLGWLINREKSQLVPSQRLVYLGADLDFTSGSIAPSQIRVSSLVSLARRILGKTSTTAKEWQRLLGMMASVTDMLDLGLLRMRPLQRYLGSLYDQQTDRQSTEVPLQEGCRPFLSWWTRPSNVSSGRPFQDRRPKATVTTDASLLGWGATFNAQVTSGRWNQHERSLHINLLETEAIHRAVDQWKLQLRDHVVTVLTDNTTAVAYVNREGGTRSPSLLAATWDLLLLCDSWNIKLVATHLAGKHNVVADALSRGRLDNNEWELAQHWANHAFSIFGRPSVDLFATPQNAKLPTFVTRAFRPDAWRTDAFSFLWDGLSLYAFPPWRLIHRVLATLRSSTADLLLVAPFWPNQPWFPLLLELLVDLPFRFPETPKLLSQRKGSLWYRDLEYLHLTAWSLSGRPSRQQDFHRRLRRLQRTPGDGLPSALTIPDSSVSDDGARRPLVIPWGPR